MKYIKTFESVTSQKQIEILTNDILIELARLSFNTVREYTSGKSLHFENVYLTKLNKDKYDDEFKKFILDERICVILTRVSKDCDTLGSYNYTHSHINLNYTDDFKNDILKELNNPKQYGEHILYFDEKNLYFDFWSKFNSTLIHELQHAWDSWKSRGKYTNTKKTHKHKNIKQLSGSNLDINKELQLHKQYIKLPHEINARFTQAIQKTRFWKLDDDWVSHQITFNDVKKDFQINFDGWSSMTPSIQKRLLHRLYQFWSTDYGKPRDVKKFKEDEND